MWAWPQAAQPLSSYQAEQMPESVDAFVQEIEVARPVVLARYTQLIDDKPVAPGLDQDIEHVIAPLADQVPVHIAR